MFKTFLICESLLQYITQRRDLTSMKRRLKIFISQKSTFIICITFLLIFIFIANGYSILKTRLNISGDSSIQDNPEWNPQIDFVNTDSIGNMFFYDITIYNNSNFVYKDWQLRIYDNEYITYPYMFEAKREDDCWVLDNSNWDNRIEPGDDVIFTIIFYVSDDLQSDMTYKEYAEYFIKNFTKLSGTRLTNPDREGEIITNGEASLTLKQSEVEIKSFKLEENYLYESDIPNEKQYILTINNTTNNDFTRIRVNLYLGSKNKVLEVTPSEIVCEHSTNITFELPSWIQISSGESALVYFMITSEDEDFIPDIVVAGETG